MVPWSDILRAAGELPIVRTIWPFLRAFLDRKRLKVEVEWHWGDEDGDAPYITVRNVGGQTVYLDYIALVEANGERNTIGTFDNHELKAGQKFSWHPVWTDEPGFDDPQFYHGWEGMRVCVCDALGKEWWSDSPTRKPSWFYLSTPFIFDDALNGVPPLSSTTTGQ
jgi:hypothetical protein